MKSNSEELQSLTADARPEGSTGQDTGRFGAESTALEVVEGIDLQDRAALVTGASSGIGVETAPSLAAAGANVVLGVRNLPAGERVAMCSFISHSHTWIA